MQMSPRIMNVAVRCLPQHSAMFGTHRVFADGVEFVRTEDPANFEEGFAAGNADFQPVGRLLMIKYSRGACGTVHMWIASAVRRSSIASCMPSAKCRMRMNRVDDIFHRSFQRHCRDGLGNHFGNGTADHVNAEDLSVFLVGDNLDESVGRIFDSCLADGHKWKLADLYFVSRFDGFRFGQPDTGNLRIAVRAIREPACS